MSATDLTLAELQTEFQSRGFDYLSSTRQTYFLNQAYNEICEADDWPFLQATATGTAPQTISDLRTIESVIDTTQMVKLTPLDRRLITDSDPTLTTAGTPEFYYLTSGTTVNVYPANTTNSLSINYWKTPTFLSGATDTPVIPNRFRLVIVTGACVWAYRDDDEFDSALAEDEKFQSQIDQMRESLVFGQRDWPDYVAAVRSEWA